MSDDREPAPPSDADRRGDIRSDFELRVGKHITLEGHASVTPIGVISAGIAVAVITLALGFAASTAWRRKR